MNETPPSYVCEMMGVTQDEWRSMSDEQRLTVAETTVTAMSEQLQELRDFLLEEIVTPLMQAARQIGEALVDCAASVETEIDQGRVDWSQATAAEQAQVHAFLGAARKYDKAANLNKM